MIDRERLADFASIGVDWLWETDADDRFTWFSVPRTKTGVELHGRIGLRRRDGAVPDPVNSERIAALERTIARLEPFHDIVFRAGHGTERIHWCSISGQPRHDAAGTFLGYRGVGRDITLQIEAQTALEIQGRTLQAILAATPDGVQLIDKTQVTLAVNDQAYDILGIPNRKDRPDAGSTFQSIVDLAKRGEYGAGDPEILARQRFDSMLAMVAANQSVTYQRQMTTGRWVEARLRSLADGAYLALYRDVTGAKEHEFELERQAALLATIISNLDCGIAVYDKDTRLVAWNDLFASLVGIDPALLRQGVTARDLLISQGLSGEFGPCDPETEADRRLTTFWADQPVVSERRRPNGSVVEFRRNPVPGGGSVTIYIDVTARRRAEQHLQDSNATLEARIAERTAALAESERFQRTIIASVPGMVYRRQNRDAWTVEFASEGSRELLGLAPERLVGSSATYDELIHPDDRKQMRQKWHQDLAAGRTFELEYRVRHSDGTWRWVLDRAEGTPDESGKIVLLEGLVLDITARRDAQQELARARDNLVDAVDSIEHNLVLHDRDDRLVLFTRHIYKQYQKSEKYFVLGRSFEEIFRDLVDSGATPVPPGQTKEQFIAQRVADRKRADGIAVERRLPDGRVMHISDHPTKSGGIVTVGVDVTERLKLEARLRDAQWMDAIGRLAGGLAHDLNNYLAIIMGNLDLLAEQDHANPESARLIEAATGGALRGAELTRSLLAFSRLQPLDPKVLDVGARIAATAKLLEPALGRKIAIDLDIAPSLWPVRIDAAQLDTCIVNLTNNARDAMPDGGRLSISARNSDPGSGPEPLPDRVLIEVRDTGTGMDAQTKAQAFEPFFTTKDTGHGSGLSMVHGFVHQSGGAIHIVSEPGKGTTIRIALPRAPQPPPAPTTRPTAALPRGSERILVVEDNEHVRATTVQQLTSLGYGVVEAASGAAALAVLESGKGNFSLVFTDLMMPGSLDGNELARLVLERWPGVRVLLTSGFSDGPSPQGPRRFETLHKPYRKADLAQAVRAALAA